MVEKETKTAIIDLDSILFAAAWGNKILDPDTGEYLRDEKGRLLYQDKTEEEIAEGIDFFFNSILSETNSTHYIAYVKGKNTGKHRYVAKSDYKSNRPKESPSWWEFAKNYAIENWKTVPVDYLEVDDAVNITRKSIPNSFIVAIDKDLLNLEGTHYNWKTKEWITINKEYAFQQFWTDMIVGQSGDGVSGLPKKGKRFAEDLISSLLEEGFTSSTVKTIEDLPSIIFNLYIEHYGEHIGIQEFYKNYTCLKILDEYKDFEIPEPILVDTKKLVSDFDSIIDNL